MNINKAQVRILGIATLIALIFSALLVVWLGGDQATLIDNVVEIQRPAEANEKPLVPSAEAESISDAQPEKIIASTPQTHDQLVVSSILEGTDIDGALKAKADGSLLLDIGVRDFFDYFLSIADDVGAETAIGEITRYADGYLPEPARSQAVELLANYLRYKQSEFEIQQTPITQTDLNDGDALQLLKSSFEQLKIKRQSLFSKEQDQALFGLEDIYANHTLESLSLMADESTTDAEKREQLIRLESRLPPELSDSFALTNNDRQRQQNIETAVGSENDDAQVYEQLEQQGLTQQQLESVISRRQQQRQFDVTYQQYQQEKKSVMAGLEEGSVAYESTLAQLQNRVFLTPEDLTQAKLRDLKQD